MCSFPMVNNASALPPQDISTWQQTLRKVGRYIWQSPYTISLFWRTFLLLTLLLLTCSLFWLQSARTLEAQPRAQQAAIQIRSLINLSRTALVHADPLYRLSLIKTLAQEESIRIIPREPDDRVEPYTGASFTDPDSTLNTWLTAMFPANNFEDLLSLTIVQTMHASRQPNALALESTNPLPPTTVARRVNQHQGLLVSFDIDGDPYWLLTDPTRLAMLPNQTWLIWLAASIVLSLLGAAIIASLVNRPLKRLLKATHTIRSGLFDFEPLDEAVPTREILQLNRGFNRMARQLAKLEQDRAVMLAGISHDMRTPLARLRLETEMSVPDREAAELMVTDIEQLDSVISKFMDYAKSTPTQLLPVNLESVVHRTVQTALQHNEGDMQIDMSIDPNLYVQADEIELSRIVVNLLENARRYGKSQPQINSLSDPVDAARPIAQVRINAQKLGQDVQITLRDHGTGVAIDDLAQLTTPFFRADTARSQASGTGLGLAIVERNVRRMGGQLQFENADGGGLQATIVLKAA